MNCLFENRYTAELEDVKRHYCFEIQRLSAAVNLLFALLILLVFGRFGIGGTTLFAVVLIVLLNGLLLNGYRLTWLGMNGQNGCSRYGKAAKRTETAAETVVRFSEDKILFEEGAYRLELKYSQIGAVMEWKEHFLLVLINKRRADKSQDTYFHEEAQQLPRSILLRKDSFRIGDCGDFEAFIARTCEPYGRSEVLRTGALLNRGKGLCAGAVLNRGVRLFGKSRTRQLIAAACIIGYIVLCGAALIGGYILRGQSPASGTDSVNGTAGMVLEAGNDLSEAGSNKTSGPAGTGELNSPDEAGGAPEGLVSTAVINETYRMFLEGKRTAADTADQEELSWAEYLSKYSACGETEAVLVCAELDLDGDGEEELVVSVTRRSAEWIQDVYAFHGEGGRLQGWEVMNFPSDRWETCIMTNGLLRDSYLHNSESEVDFYQYSSDGRCTLAAQFTKTAGQVENGETAEEQSAYEAPAALWVYKLEE